MKIKSLLTVIGPGIVMAATGLGAGDLVAASVAGSQFGVALAWAVVLGALIKFILNEALGRWQLTSGETLLESWCSRFPFWFSGLFFTYLILWSILVGAALMAACGLAANALFPQFSTLTWAVIHSTCALLLILTGRYQRLETLMKALIALMFVTVVSAVFFMDVAFLPMVSAIAVPQIPQNSLALALSVVGGVGGSVTLLCYGYWMREKAWDGKRHIARIRIDLAVGYLLTAIFALCIMLLAAKIQPPVTKGSQMLVVLADAMGASMGDGFRWLFLLGVWGAVFSSMLGVWQGVPYLISDSLTTTKPLSKCVKKYSSNQIYRWSLIFIATVPVSLLLFGKPVWLVLIYSFAGAFFMPLLALTLLLLQHRLKQTPWISQIGIFASLVLFSVIALQKWL